MYTLPARDSSTPPTPRRRQEINEDLAGSLGHCAETLHEDFGERRAAYKRETKGLIKKKRKSSSRYERTFVAGRNDVVSQVSRSLLRRDVTSVNLFRALPQEHDIAIIFR